MLLRADLPPLLPGSLLYGGWVELCVCVCVCVCVYFWLWWLFLTCLLGRLHFLLGWLCVCGVPEGVCVFVCVCVFVLYVCVWTLPVDHRHVGVVEAGARSLLPHYQIIRPLRLPPPWWRHTNAAKSHVFTKIEQIEVKSNLPLVSGTSPGHFVSCFYVGSIENGPQLELLSGLPWLQLSWTDKSYC